MNCSLPGSSAHEIFLARVLEWVAIPFSRGSSWPKDRTWLSHIAGRFFTGWATREAYEIHFLRGHMYSRVYKIFSRGWFRSIDLWVMGPARFRCATLLTFRAVELKFNKAIPGSPHTMEQRTAWCSLHFRLFFRHRPLSIWVWPRVISWVRVSKPLPCSATC